MVTSFWDASCGQQGMAGMAATSQTASTSLAAQSILDVPSYNLQYVHVVHDVHVVHVIHVVHTCCPWPCGKWKVAAPSAQARSCKKHICSSESRCKTRPWGILYPALNFPWASRKCCDLVVSHHVSSDFWPSMSRLMSYHVVSCLIE